MNHILITFWVSLDDYSSWREKKTLELTKFDYKEIDFDLNSLVHPTECMTF